MPMRSETPLAGGQWLKPTLILAVLYYFTARLSLTLAFQQTNASPVWPPSGLGFAALLVFSYRLWPGIFLGAFFANTVVFMTNGVADLLTTLIVSANIGIGNTLEAVTGVFMVRHLVGENNPFDRIRDVFLLIGTALMMCLVSATIGPNILCLTGIVPWELLQTVMFTWWLGDTAGVLVLAPLLLSRYKRPSPAQRHWLSPEFIVFFASLLFILLLIFGGGAELSRGNYPVAHLLFPWVLWAAVRYGQAGAGATLISIAILSILGTVNGFGAFARGTLNESLLLLEAFIGVITITGMILITALNERHYAQEAVRRALAIKDEFTSTVSHELRTPLAIAKEGLSLLMRERVGKLSEKQREIAAICTSHLDRLGVLINDILDFSKTEAKKMELDKKIYDVSDIIKDCYRGYKLQAQKKEIDFVLFVPEHPILLSVDKLRFLQIISNLINNALKFTPRSGKVEIRVNDMPTLFEFSVKDSGPGIAQRDLGNLFQKFSQLKREYGPGAQGTGLGLSIAKSLVELHGGRIYVESDPGKGAKFVFTIPKTEVPQEVPPIS